MTNDVAVVVSSNRPARFSRQYTCADGVYNWTAVVVALVLLVVVGIVLKATWQAWREADHGIPHT